MCIGICVDQDQIRTLIARCTIAPLPSSRWRHVMTEQIFDWVMSEHDRCYEDAEMAHTLQGLGLEYL